MDVLNNHQMVDDPSLKTYSLAPDTQSINILGFDVPTSGSFVHGFMATFCIIVMSELGDKTFFIAAIMAMRHPRLVVLSGAVAALVLMHVMSAFFGVFFLYLVPRIYTYYASSLLFAIFGIKMLKEGWYMKPGEAQEEMEEVQEKLLKKEAHEEDAGVEDLEEGSLGAPIALSIGRFRRFTKLVFSPIFLQAFTMTFIAEWGDRSQLATIVLAAREIFSAVIIAGILGHTACTTIAVIGGRFVAQKISVKTITLMGGVIFILFALTAFLIDTNNDGVERRELVVNLS